MGYEPQPWREALPYTNDVHPIGWWFDFQPLTHFFQKRAT